jgi:hypothetical protein
MPKVKRDNISRKGYSVLMRWDLVKKIKLSAVNRDKMDYEIVEEAIIEYFEKRKDKQEEIT